MKPPVQIKKKQPESEQIFEAYLEEAKRKGEIIDYRSEPIKFILAHSLPGIRKEATYKPDFMIVYEDHFEFAEIKDSNQKGKMKWTSKREDDTIKLKVVAELYPWFKFVLYTRDARNNTFKKTEMN